ncbi:SLAP domain-containing protein [Oceanobacillus senegalensis]|uniref:SLAP domain-containing protein n=1 Tax=Oceanobacillus senegalensis TaxID=1936063 RepID=UPI000A312FCF|nr:SLAP domain-containing protein [Oceanobacillus senegalensis]
MIMMQKLQFESKWDKTIADKDRENIKQIFNQIKLEEKPNIQFTLLKEAINHRGDLLVTVLMHNISNNDFPIHQKEIYYVIDDEILAKQTFDFPHLIVEKHTSMPWTFIFSNHSVASTTKKTTGTIILKNQ